MITRRQIGWILIVGSIVLAIIGFINIDFTCYPCNPFWKHCFFRFLIFLLENACVGEGYGYNSSFYGICKYCEGIYYANWLIFCVILAFIGSILVITYKPKQ
jgi:hypothetical protein